MERVATRLELIADLIANPIGSKNFSSDEESRTDA
jgi:hypothetical protein